MGLLHRPEELHDVDGVLVEGGAVLQAQFSPVEDPCPRHRLPADREEGLALSLLQEPVDLFQQLVGQVGGGRRVHVVRPHEPLHPVRLAVGPVAEEVGHLLLDLEGQDVGLLPREEVQLVTDAEQVREGVPDGPDRLGGGHSLVSQVEEVMALVLDARRPDGGVQVPQPPPAFLDVGLEDVHRGAELRVPVSHLLDLLFDELVGVRVEEELLDLLLRLAEERLVPGDEPVVEEGGADRIVGGGHPDRLLDVAHAVPHLQPQVPQRIEHPLGHRLDVAVQLVGMEEQQVDIGFRAQLLPAVPPDRDDGHPVLEVRRKGQVPPPRPVVKGTQDGVHRSRVPAAGNAPVGRGVPQLFPEGGKRTGKVGFQVLEELAVGKILGGGGKREGAGTWRSL
jgi:hypothetical protein